MDLDMSYADNFTLQDEIETFSVTSVPSLDMLSDKNKKAIKKLHKKGYLKINPLQSHGKIETDHNDSMTFQVKNSVITPECLSEVKGDQCHASATSTQKSRKRKIREPIFIDGFEAYCYSCKKRSLNFANCSHCDIPLPKNSIKRRTST
ncbi:hypothetical protein TKK_0012660 [Trichogramma kaykai]